MKNGHWGKLIAFLSGTAAVLIILLVYVIAQRYRIQSTAREPTQTIDLSADEGDHFAPLRMLVIAENMPTRHMKEMVIFATDRAMKGYVFDYNNEPIQITDEQIGKVVFGDENIRPPNTEPPKFIWWLNQNGSDTSSFTSAENGECGFATEFHDKTENEWSNILLRIGGDDYRGSFELLRLAEFIHEDVTEKQIEPTLSLAKWADHFSKCQVRHCKWITSGSERRFFLSARRVCTYYTFTIRLDDVWKSKRSRAITITFEPNE